MSRARRTRLTAAAAVVTALAVAACQLIIDVQDEQGAPRTTVTPDAAPPGDDDASTGPPCALAMPPARPVMAGDTTGLPYFFAIRTAFSKGAEGGVIGYDLDGRCTYADADSPCKGSPDDHDGGVDNAFYLSVLAKLPIPASPGSDPVIASTNAALAAGTSGVYLALYGYDGTENDSMVSLGVVSSPGLLSTACGDAGAEAGPRWDGCDVWALGDAPVANDIVATRQSGYVAKGILVVPYADAELSIRFGGLMLSLRDGFITAKLSRQDAGLELVDGVLTGRMATAPLFETAVRVPIDVAGTTAHICDNEFFVAPVHRDLCTGRDLLVTRGDRGAACDAISVALGFTASPTTSGRNGLVFAPPYACPMPVDAACP